MLAIGSTMPETTDKGREVNFMKGVRRVDWETYLRVKIRFIIAITSDLRHRIWL